MAQGLRYFDEMFRNYRVEYLSVNEYNAGEDFIIMVMNYQFIMVFRLM